MGDLPPKLPSTIALSCFVATARHLNVTKAAEELCLTQSAVSRQIKLLEQFVGNPLFDRVKQRLRLTSIGAVYYHRVSQSLEQLTIATQEAMKQLSGRLRVGAEPSFTARWLIPRLGGYTSKYPEVAVDIVNDLHQLYDLQEGYDVGILHGDGHWPGFFSIYLMDEQLVAICSPELRALHGKLNEARDILRYPLLHHTSIHSSTGLWLASAGLESHEIDALPGQRFQHFQALLEAAVHGLGCTVLPRYFVARELASGSLVMAGGEELTSEGKGFYVVIPEYLRDDMNAKSFSDWLLGSIHEH